MGQEELVLKEEGIWVDLIPVMRNDRLLGKIVAGTFGKTGDLMALPPGETWEEAGELVAGGQTRVAPTDLDLVEDALTRSSFSRDMERLEAFLKEDDEEQLAIDDPPAIAVDERLARQVAEELAKVEDAPRRHPGGMKRRRADRVA